MELPVSTRRLPALLVGDPSEEAHLQQIRFALLSAGIAWAGEVVPEEAAAALDEGSYDLVILASDRPVRATTTVQALRAVPHCPPVIVLAATARATQLVEVLAAGAAGYLLSDMPARELARAIDCGIEGETVVPRSVITVAAEQLRLDSGAAGARGEFTQRERQVLALLREGRSTREIADELNVSPATVRTHVAAVVHKLKVEDRAAAARTGATGA